jgi:transposase
MMKLCEHLNTVDRNWRKSTVIMLDNAPYHRSIAVKSKLQELRIPLMYLGPYQFKMAPIELFFSFIKSKDLNPLRSKIPTR